MAIINGTDFNDNNTYQGPFGLFFSQLNGTAGDDSIFGFGGHDILIGYDGNDLLDGGIGDDYLNGGTGDDYLYSGDGNDTLDGDAGADTMNGGLGHDTYYVDNVGDVILNTTTSDPALGEVNAPLGGIDLVHASISYTLGASLEWLYLAGIGNINGTGNNQDNNIDGNPGNNVLDGGTGNDFLSGNAGADILYGGDGDDYYYGGAGNDTLTDINGGADHLDGGIGADTMNGGDGNDTYWVNNPLDVIVGEINDNLGGVDIVIASTTYTLMDSLENLYLDGYAPIKGTGNAHDNVIDGNWGAIRYLAAMVTIPISGILAMTS